MTMLDTIKFIVQLLCQLSGVDASTYELVAHNLDEDGEMQPGAYAAMALYRHPSLGWHMVRIVPTSSLTADVMDVTPAMARYVYGRPTTQRLVDVTWPSDDSEV